MILLLAARDGDDDPAAAFRDAPQLAQCCQLAALALLAGSVHPVVATDVLEGGDAEDEVEAGIRERELAHVRDHGAHPRDLRLGQIDAHELGDVRRDERCHVRRLRVRRPDVQDAPRALDAGERPGDLDCALVRSGRGLEEPRRLACRERSRDGVVERTQLGELLARDELRHERRPRDLPLERVRLGIAAQDEPVRAPDELLVRELRELEPSGQPVVHSGRS